MEVTLKLKLVKFKYKFLLLILVPVFFTLSVLHKTEPLKIKNTAQNLGLKNVTVNIDQKRLGKYTLKFCSITSSNFSDLSFDEMLDINENLINSYFPISIKKYVCNEHIYECDSNSKIIKMDGIEIYNDYKHSNEYKKLLEEEKKKAAEEQKKHSYANNYPFIGMREEYLNYTILGNADSIEKCPDFNYLAHDRKYKTYIWKETSEYVCYKVTVEYRKYNGKKYNDYSNLPLDNGYVSSICYTDKKGNFKSIN